MVLFMWIVGRDMVYYPSIYKFQKEEDARKIYDDIKADILNGECPEGTCVFIAEVKEYFKDKQYNMIDYQTWELIK